MEGTKASRTLLSGLLLSLAVPATWAETAESVEEYIRQHDNRVAEQANHIPSLVENYAGTIGCAYSMDSRNVLPYEIERKAVRVVLYALDRGCTGGSAMQQPEIAAVVLGADDKFYVAPEFSSTALMHPSIVDRIYVRDGQLRYEGRNLGGDDALCCPSKRTAGRLVFEPPHWSFKNDASAAGGDSN